MSVITSRDNKWLKTFRAALRGTGPQDNQPLGVEGPKAIVDALRAGAEPEALLVSEAQEGEIEHLLRAMGESEMRIAPSHILRTTERLFAGVSATEAPQGIAALFRQPQWQFEDVLRGRADSDGRLGGSDPLVVVLAGIQDPGNVGTILRSAEAFGATGAVAARGTADPWSPKALRASAGSALRIPILRGISIPVLMAQMRVAGVTIVAASSREGESGLKPAIPLESCDMPLAIFVGSEGGGLPAEVKREAGAVVSIPMVDAVESLNAGVAASLVLYEVARRRGSFSTERKNAYGIISNR